MPPAAHNSRLELNARLYPWYAASYNTFFWMPVFFLYFSEYFTLNQVLILEAIYYASVFALEIPSGYFSDTIGRKPTLLISSLALVLAYLLFFFAGSFEAFALAQFFLAAGISFNSGTDVSFHYDTLDSLGRTETFGAREAIVSSNSFYAGAFGALAGGGIAFATGDLRYAYGLAALAAIITIGIVLVFVEPSLHARPTLLGRGIFRQLRQCVKYLKQPTLLWLFAFAVLMTVLNHIPYEFYQPYFDLLATDLDLPNRNTPLAAGIATFLTMIIAGFGAGRSIKIRDRLGTGPTLLLAAVLQTAIIAIMGLIFHPLIIALILLRSMPRALMAAPLNAAIAPLVSQQHRATYLSLQSLVGRLAFAGVLLGLSVLAGKEAVIAWPHLALMLKASALLGLVCTVLLALTIIAVKRKPDE